MTTLGRLGLLVLLVCLFLPAPAAAVSTTDTRLLTQPAISAANIAFVYADDLWVAGLDGTNVRRLTTRPGRRVEPGVLARRRADRLHRAVRRQHRRLRRAGRRAACRSGSPGTRAPTSSQGFTPDGKAVLFTSRARGRSPAATRSSSPCRSTGGFADAAADPERDARPRISPDGKRIAYIPLADAFTAVEALPRRHATRASGSIDTRDHAVEKVPQPAGRCNDVDPMWIGDTLYFRSDRDGEFNLFAFDRATKAVTQLTTHADFPVLDASAGGGQIVYEQAGYLHLSTPRRAGTRRLTIGVAADLVETAPALRRRARSGSATRGALALRRARGVRVPRRDRDRARREGRRRATSPRRRGVHERSPAWSPDGKSIAYFSDAGGEYELVRRARRTARASREELQARRARASTSDPRGRPTARRSRYTDNSLDAVLDRPRRRARRRRSRREPLYGPVGVAARTSWSPDSHWLAYTLEHAAPTSDRCYVYSLDQDKSFPVTDGLSDVTEPVFDASGKYLYFLGSTDAGPGATTGSRRRTPTCASTQRDLPGGAARRTCRRRSRRRATRRRAKKAETPRSRREAGRSRTRRRATKDAEGREEAATKPVGRSTSTASTSGSSRCRCRRAIYDDLAGRRGRARSSTGAQLDRPSTTPPLYRYDLEKRKDETLAAGGRRLPRCRPTARSVAVPAEGRRGRSSTSTDKVDARRRASSTSDAIEVQDRPARRVDADLRRGLAHQPRLLLRPEHARRRLDGDAGRSTRRSCRDLATRDDLNRVIQWMCSELAVGHSPRRPRRHARRADDGAGRPARRRLRGRERPLPLQEGLRRPELEPRAARAAHRAGRRREGGRVPARGRTARTCSRPTNLYARFENTAGQDRRDHGRPEPRRHGLAHGQGRAGRERGGAAQPRLGRGQPAEGRRGDRRPRRLRLRAEHRRRSGHTYFKRYFFPQADKDAIIVDERFNGGGQVADYYIDILRRPLDRATGRCATAPTSRRRSRRSRGRR